MIRAECCLHVYLLTNLQKQADFWQVNIFHLVLLL